MFTTNHWYLKKYVTRIKFDTPTQKTVWWTYKWEKSNKLTLKIVMFTATWSISNILTPAFLKIDKMHYKGINIYYIGYITILKINDSENIYVINSLYLIVNHVNGYIEEESGNK